MTVEDFDKFGKYEKSCMACGRGGMERELNEHNQMRVICPHCGSKTAWGSFNLKQNNRTTRKAYPFGEDLDDVWARFDNRCVVCSRDRAELKQLGVGRQRQHVAPYASEQHRGPLVSICTRCHEIANVLQKDAAVMRGFMRHSRTHGEPVFSGSGGVSTPWLSPDSVRPEGEAPASPVEGLSDDDAND